MQNLVAGVMQPNKSRKYWRIGGAVASGVALALAGYWWTKSAKAPQAVVRTSKLATVASQGVRDKGSNVLKEYEQIDLSDEQMKLNPLKPVEPLKEKLTKTVEEVKVVEGSEGERTAYDELKSSGKPLIDGNTAVSYVAYGLTDYSFVFPVTPNMFLGEDCLNWVKAQSGLSSTDSDHRTFFGREKVVKILETRPGMGRIIEGVAETGSLVSVLLPGEALPSLIPSLPSLAWRKRPVVFHVAARAVSEKNEILTDFSTVMTVGAVGGGGSLAIIGSNTVQEAHDMAVVSHIAALKAGIPFVHFFDGAKVARAYEKVKLLDTKYLEGTVKDSVMDYRSGSPIPLPIDVVNLVDQIMEFNQSNFGRRYKPFEFVGDSKAEFVVVALGPACRLAAEEFIRFSRASLPWRIGVLSVRLYRPWSVKHFLDALPLTVKAITVLEQCQSSQLGWGPLYRDVVSSMSLSGSSVPITTGQATSHITPSFIKAIFTDLASSSPKPVYTVGTDNVPTALPIDLLFDIPSPNAQISVWDTSINSNNSTWHSILKDISTGESYSRMLVQHDSYCLQGSTHITIHLGRPDVPNPTLDDLVICHYAKFINEYNLVASLKDSGTLVLNAKHTEIVPTLPASIKRELVRRKVRLLLLDVAALSDLYEDVNPTKFRELAYLSIIYRCISHKLTTPKALHPLSNHILKDVIEVTPGDDWGDAQDEVEQPLPTEVEGSLIPQNAYPKKKDPLGFNFKLPSVFLTFSSSFKLRKDLRPVGGAHTTNHIVKLTKFVRLTPLDYDRNIFHMEIDISKTTLKYDMGEALAVYGLNPEQQTVDFITWYNLNPIDIVYIPQKDKTYALRTVYQLFRQYLDIFGRPSKKFYKGLAECAQLPAEKEKLLWIISEEGAQEFARRVAETITYEDLLREFPSAKPTLDDLISLVAPIKPRHYSIASSMKMHPTSVHLLVVVDDWKTPSGKYRVGQCSGYLSTLTNPETSDIYLTVSVAPSLMKLPPKHSQPVVMAGLGTGMAPFRAFLQERQYFASKGEKVGPMALYFGSRYRSKEYLYAEELEALHASGLLTYLRLAFSRDQAEKVYIQHKIKNDNQQIYDMLVKEKGHFYLCGPTDPVGDVFDAIVSDFVGAGTMEKKDAENEVQKMKQEGRYVLEVY